MDWEKLYLIIIDKALMGVLLLIIGLWINKKLERYKIGLEESVGTRVRIAERRLPSYRQLWEITQPTTKARKADLSMPAREKLYEKLCTWYYQEGNGIFLSNKTRDLYLSAREDLIKESVSNEAITETFSTLRTEIKNEIGIYGKQL